MNINCKYFKISNEHLVSIIRNPILPGLVKSVIWTTGLIKNILMGSYVVPQV